MRKAVIFLVVLVAASLLFYACKGRIDERLIEDAEAATTLRFSPVADTFVSASTPDTVHGAQIQLKTDGVPQKVSYLRFDVSGIPEGASVTSAKLRLYVSDATPDGQDARNINGTW